MRLEGKNLVTELTIGLEQGILLKQQLLTLRSSVCTKNVTHILHYISYLSQMLHHKCGSFLLNSFGWTSYKNTSYDAKKIPICAVVLHS